VVRIFREGLMEEAPALVLPEPEAEPVPGAPVSASIKTPDIDRPVRLTEITHSYPEDAVRPYLRTGEALTVNVGFHANIASDDVVFSFELRNNEGAVLIRTDTDIMGNTFGVPSGPGTVQLRIGDIPMLDGDFSYSIGIQSRGGLLYDSREPAGTFEVMSTSKTTGMFSLPVQASLLSTDLAGGAELIAQQASQLH
jgi:hypothetical protein